MNAVMIDVRDLAIQDVSVTDEDLSVDLTDGRSLTVPFILVTVASAAARIKPESDETVTS